MPLTRLVRPFALAFLLLFASAAGYAQEASPEPDASPAGEAAPKPKPRPRKPAPKPASPAKADAAAAPAPVPLKATWPEGASSVTETYGDWTVNCVRTEVPATCTLVQSQGSKRDNKREFAVELKTPANERTEGLILMPFGFSIEPGVAFKLDEAVLGKGAPFFACGQEGCIVPISLPTLATDTMKTAQKLLVIAQKPDAKEQSTITVSLAGFGPALARASALAN